MRGSIWRGRYKIILCLENHKEEWFELPNSLRWQDILRLIKRTVECYCAWMFPQNHKLASIFSRFVFAKLKQCDFTRPFFFFVKNIYTSCRLFEISNLSSIWFLQNLMCISCLFTPLCSIIFSFMKHFPSFVFYKKHLLKTLTQTCI